MAVVLALPLFAVSLVVTLAAARLFARRLDVLGVRFGFSEALVGLLTALAADGPEISSALISLARGEHAVSVGVVVGSNVFNLAAMIGLSAVIAGGVRLPRAALALEGTVALLVTMLAAGVLLDVLTPIAGATLTVLVGAPYLLLLLSGSRGGTRLPLPAKLREALASVLATRAGQRPARMARSVDHRRQLLMIVSDIGLILLGSAGMVQSAVALGGRWGVSGTLIGVLVLGPLTSIPNAQTAIRLGLLSRGAALVSEAFASNTINLLGGVVVPALFVEVASRPGIERLDLGWLALITLVSIYGLARPGGVGRRGGAVLLLLYGAFVALQLSW
jgi:cation:H+ antiporter